MFSALTWSFLSIPVFTWPQSGRARIGQEMSNKVRLMKQQEDLELTNASTTYQYHAYHLFDIDNMSQLYHSESFRCSPPYCKDRQVTLNRFDPLLVNSSQFHPEKIWPIVAIGGPGFASWTTSRSVQDEFGYGGIAEPPAVGPRNWNLNLVHESKTRVTIDDARCLSLLICLKIWRGSSRHMQKSLVPQPSARQIADLRHRIEKKTKKQNKLKVWSVWSATISHHQPSAAGGSSANHGHPRCCLDNSPTCSTSLFMINFGAFVWMPLGCAELSICFCHRKLKLRIRLCQLLNMFLKPRSQSAGTCWNHRIPSVLSIVQFVTIHSINKAIQR